MPGVNLVVLEVEIEVGIPVYFFLRLYMDRRANRLPLAILTASYEDQFWWYECVEVRVYFLNHVISIITHRWCSCCDGTYWQIL